MSYNEHSHYVARFSLTDRDGEPIQLDEKDIEYVVTTRLGGGDELFSAGTDDPEVRIEPDDETGRVDVQLDASDVEWSGIVFEELRVTPAENAGESIVVEQRSTTFDPSASEF